jgi:hypothetical protein
LFASMHDQVNKACDVIGICHGIVEQGVHGVCLMIFDMN